MIIDAVARGDDEREVLKSLCEKAGMTDSESKSLFDPWGGLIRAICESGRICHKVQEKKAYRLCPKFEPMLEEDARLELARRYFTHFGPATIKDAAYFFGTTQSRVKSLLQKLPVVEAILDSKSYFYVDSGMPSGELPSCLFLAGFDQLMLGYEKTESLFLPKEHVRNIFSLAGIVRPAILVDGNVAGWWNIKNRKLTINMFGCYDAGLIAEKANSLWTDIKKIEFL